LAYRWFKPLLVAALGLVFMLVFQLALLVTGHVWSPDPNFIYTISSSYDDMNPYTGPGALVEIGGIAAMLPALALAALIVRDRPLSSYSSSRGGWNWGAFLKCLAVAAAVVGTFAVVDLLIPSGGDGDGVYRFTVEGVILCVALTPLQCVAEEYVFRGLLMQTIGAWTRLPLLAVTISAALFAASHPYNLIGVATIFIDGLVWGALTWKTSGLEATSAVHIANNMLAFLLGGFGLQATTSEVDVLSAAVMLAIDIIYAAAIILLGKKFNWFSSKGDGAAAFNEEALAKRRREQL